MTDRIGEFARSYWPVIVGCLLFAAAWGALVWQNANTASTVDKMNTNLTLVLTKTSAIEATVTAKSEATSNDIADLRARMRAFEARR